MKNVLFLIAVMILFTGSISFFLLGSVETGKVIYVDKVENYSDSASVDCPSGQCCKELGTCD